jgi:hypothetical protein
LCWTGSYIQESATVAICWWNDRFGYAMAAKADRDPPLRIAEFVYRQTTPDGDRAKMPPAPGKPSRVFRTCSRNKVVPSES